MERKLSSGFPQLDDLLNGGFTLGTINEIEAERTVDLDKLVFQLCYYSQLPYSQGGFSGNILYYDLSRDFSHSNFTSFANRLKIDTTLILDKIVLLRSEDYELNANYLDLFTLVRDHNIKLIIINPIDGIIRKYLEQSEGLIDLPLMPPIIQHLKNLARIFEELTTIYVKRDKIKYNIENYRHLLIRDYDENFLRANVLNSSNIAPSAYALFNKK